MRESRFTDKDLEFLIDAGSPGVSDRMRLKEILREDDDFRDALIGDEKIFRRLMHDEEILLTQFESVNAYGKEFVSTIWTSKA